MAFVLACSHPPIRLERTGASVVVHLETLGEYATAIQRIKITEELTDRVVWELDAAEGVPQLWRFSLIPGRNEASLNAVGGRFRVVVPRDQATFDLSPAGRYRMDVWGSGPRPSSVYFSFE